MNPETFWCESLGCDQPADRFMAVAYESATKEAIVCAKHYAEWRHAAGIDGGVIMFETPGD